MEEKVLKSSKHGIITIIICLIIIAIGIIALNIFISGVGGAGNLTKIMLRNMLLLSIVPTVIIAVIIFLANVSCSLTITNKRVYGKTVFSKSVNLPLDSISAVGTSAFKGITVSTSSGVIKFRDIANRDELFDTLNSLLIERQSKNVATTIIEKSPEVPASVADELKKYKDLLDTGILTQEEFDAKKKQLLGL